MKKSTFLWSGIVVALALAAGFSSPGHAMPDWNLIEEEAQLTKKFEQTGGGWTGPAVGVCWMSACTNASSCCRVVEK